VAASSFSTFTFISWAVGDGIAMAFRENLCTGLKTIVWRFKSGCERRALARKFLDFAPYGL
jgi:hypothetical protein